MGGEIFAKTAKTPPLQPDVCGDADATNLALGISPGDYMVGQGGAREGEDGRVIANRPPMRPHTLCSDVACRIALKKRRVAHGRLPIQISHFARPHYHRTNSIPTQDQLPTCAASCSGFALRRDPNMKRRR